MIFTGIEPVTAGGGLTEVTLTDGRQLDLFNAADLLGLNVRPMSREIVLTFRLIDDGTVLVWTFSGVGPCRFEAEGFAFTSLEHQEFVAFEVDGDPAARDALRWCFSFTDLELTFTACATVVRAAGPEASDAETSRASAADVYLAALGLTLAHDAGPLPVDPAVAGRPSTMPSDEWRRAVRARDPRLRMDVRGVDLVLAGAEGRARVRVSAGGGDAWLDASGDEIVLRVPTSTCPDVVAAAVTGVLAGAVRR